MEHYYYTISESGIAEFKDRGSKFIAFAEPLQNVASFKELLQNIKTAHPKADHFCFAYRIGFDGNNFRVSDAGEPSGTAGKPILGQIDSKQLTNVLIVVVRYFGGSLLGVPGLINAYKTAASFALQTTPIIQKERMATFSIEYDYTKTHEVNHIIKQARAQIEERVTNLFLLIKVDVPVSEKIAFSQNMNRLDGVLCKEI